MTFVQTGVDENYDILKFVSSQGGWEMGLKSMMFGARVRVGMTGAPTVDVDLCGGADHEDQMELLRMVMMILIPADETITPRELSDLFPKCKVKPVILDACWEELRMRAEKALEESSS